MYCISKLRLDEILERKDLKRGKYICCYSKSEWVAIDNSTSDKWTEVFKRCDSALTWLSYIPGI